MSAVDLPEISRSTPVPVESISPSVENGSTTSLPNGSANRSSNVTPKLPQFQYSRVIKIVLQLLLQNFN